MATDVLAPKLSDQELADLLETIEAADSVELKLTIPVSDRSRTGELLGVDPMDGQIRQVYFFDTPDLALNAQRPRGSRSSRARKRRRLRREAAARRARRAAR